MVTSGAAQVTISRIDGRRHHYFTEGDKGFYRDSSRTAPYNLFTDMSETATLVDQDELRAARRLPAVGRRGRTSRRASPRARWPRSFSGGHTTNWRFEGGTYVNENTYAGPATSSRPTPCWCCGSRSATPATATRPATRCPRRSSRAQGQALIFHDGRLVRGTWTKDDLGAPLELSTKAGELTVPAGHTWIELVPQDGGDVTFGK